MITLQIFGVQSNEVPSFLEPKVETYVMYLIAILSLSFFFIAISRIGNNKSLVTVVAVLFKNQGVDQLLKENMRLGSFSSIVLMLNYFICFGLCVFLTFQRIIILEDFWAFLLALSLPIGLFIVEFMGPLIIGFLTGESKKVTNVTINTVTGNQFFGLLFSFIALFWIMNPLYNLFFLAFFLSLVALKYLIRFFKSSYIVLISGISWYYLILYFCTLEILPLFIVYYYVFKNFLF